VRTPYGTVMGKTGRVFRWVTVGLSMIAPVGCAHNAVAAEVQGNFTDAIVAPADDSNPDLVGGCGIDVALVLDASSSISDANAVDLVASAAQAYLDSLAETGSRVAVVNFKSSAAIAIGYEPVTIGSIASGGRHWAAVHSTDATSNSYLAAASSPSGRRTNWEAALEAVGRAEAPELVVLVTDGVPTSYNDPAGNVTVAPDTPQGAELAAEESRTSAEALRAAGSHLLAVAVGAISGEVRGDNYRHDPPLGVKLLERILGETSETTGFFFDAGSEADVTYEAATDDVVVVNDFNLLGTRLRELARSTCAPPTAITEPVSDPLPPTGPRKTLITGVFGAALVTAGLTLILLARRVTRHGPGA
jgi:hypothetical protein